MKLKYSLGLLSLLISLSLVYVNRHPVQSVPPSSFKDVLSNSQLSYFAVLSSGNTAGNSVVLIGTSGPSKTTNNLFAGDTLAIGVGGSMHLYTIRDIGNTATMQLNTGTSAVDVGASAVAIATRSATHTISFVPNSSYNGGSWEFLIKITSTAGETYNDGIPDMNGFDVKGVVGGDITCPFSGSASVGGTVAVTTSNPPTTSYYQSFSCTTPTGNSIGGGVTGTIVIGNTNKIINPSPNHGVNPEGYADVYTMILRHYDGSSTLIDADTTYGRIAVVESVRVTATIDPTLTFIIDSGTTNFYCGVPLANAQSSVTATAVPFGSIAIGSTANTLAQRLAVITNGSGYVVTAYEMSAMRNLDGTGTTIPDTDCDTNSCTINSSAGWTGPDGSKSEFGYSLQSLGGSPTMAFTSGANFTSKPFGIGATSAVTLFSSASTPTTTNYVAVCYRVTATSIQRAGDYENQVVYTATATF